MNKQKETRKHLLGGGMLEDGSQVTALDLEP